MGREPAAFSALRSLVCYWIPFLSGGGAGRVLNLLAREPLPSRTGRKRPVKELSKGGLLDKRNSPAS